MKLLILLMNSIFVYCVFGNIIHYHYQFENAKSTTNLQTLHKDSYVPYTEQIRIRTIGSYDYLTHKSGEIGLTKDVGTDDDLWGMT